MMRENREVVRVILKSPGTGRCSLGEREEGESHPPPPREAGGGSRLPPWEAAGLGPALLVFGSIFFWESIESFESFY